LAKSCPPLKLHVFRPRQGRHACINILAWQLLTKQIDLQPFIDGSEAPCAFIKPLSSIALAWAGIKIAPYFSHGSRVNISDIFQYSGIR
jgi:hypothetical protein